MKTKKSGPPGKPLEPTRVCYRCGVEKPIEEFSRSFRMASGYQGTCKACIYERRRELAEGKPPPSRTSKSVPGSTYRPTRKPLSPFRVCTKCSIEKPIEDFPTDKTTFSGKKGICKSCYAEYKRSFYLKDPTYMTREFLWRRYKMTIEQYDQMAEDQQNKCAICGKETQARLLVDHNHTTGQVRDLLCTRCNTMIGMAYESKDILLAAMAYLEKWNTTQG